MASAFQRGAHLRKGDEMSESTSYLLAFSLSCLLLGGSGCAEPGTPIAEARSAYFATVDGSDEDCADWLDWCLSEGYPQEACEERNEYCVEGRWAGGERGDDESDACGEAARAAERACVADGGSDEECREAAAVAYEECLED